MIKAWGKTYSTIEQARARVAELEKVNAEFGRSDDRVSELHALAEVLPIETPKQGTQFFGKTARERGTQNRTHFLNGWEETFCGTLIENVQDLGRDRAQCRRCQQAGDALMRDSDFRPGSPARR